MVRARPLSQALTEPIAQHSNEPEKRNPSERDEVQRQGNGAGATPEPGPGRHNGSAGTDVRRSPNETSSRTENAIPAIAAALGVL
jgi:hypothetical protein